MNQNENMYTRRDVDVGRGEKRNFESFDRGGRGGSRDGNNDEDYEGEEESDVEEGEEEGFQFIYAQGDYSYYKHKVVRGTVIQNGISLQNDYMFYRFILLSLPYLILFFFILYYFCFVFLDLSLYLISILVTINAVYQYFVSL